MEDIVVENIVASTTLADQLDLDAIALALEGAEYEPEQFPGLIYRLKDPKTAMLIFRSGKANCTGAKNLGDVRTCIHRVRDALDKSGVDVYDDPEITVQNMVAVYDLKTELNLNAIAISLGLENVEYEPEQFPGLVYRIFDPKVVMLLFGSGKVVCTGARKMEDIEIAVKRLRVELSNAGLLH